MEAGNVVASGEVGEITIRSRGIASGYFDEPDKTARLFEVDPHDPALRTFKTGDMGHFDDSNQLIYAGRRARMIKINGQRVELDYVAATLRKHPEIEEADVRTWPDSHRGVQLAAYFTTPKSSPLDTESLHHWLLEQLPHYMVPTHLHQLDSLPLHSSGKINRQALPEPQSLRRSKPENEFLSDPTERAVLELWRKLLKNPTLGPDDNYFAVGGDSLLAVQLLLEAALFAGRELPPHVLMRAPTARQFSAAIKQAPDQVSNLICIQSTGTRAPFFWVHGRSDDLFLTLRIARDLDSDRPTFLIECNQQCGQQEPPSSVETMAAQYADLIEQYLTSRPCILEGYSLGATFAFAIAAELQRRKREIPTVVVINRPPMNLPPFIKFRMAAPDMLWRVR